VETVGLEEAHGLQIPRTAARTARAAGTPRRSALRSLGPRAAETLVRPPRRRSRSGRRKRPKFTWRHGVRAGVETAAFLGAALIAVIGALGYIAEWFGGAGVWSHLVPFAGAVLGLSVGAGIVLRFWVVARAWLARHSVWLPVCIAVAVVAAATWFAMQPAFTDQVSNLRTLVGGPAEAERVAIAHQVYAAYRRTDLKQMRRLLERARVYESTVYEAADEFGVDPEVLMGIGAVESSFNPRDSRDGGRGLFQITAPPEAAVLQARKRLGEERLDLINQRHNAFLAAATLQRYLDDMRGDLFLALLAYNIGPRNGGLQSIMRQYGARDFVTIQPYLQNLPRDYPIRVLSAALAYRLWRTHGRLPHYEQGDNARRIQAVGIPGFPSDLERANS
jgi:soluble lytic murein transglycosylase-like protein